jgi:ubiquinone/menaquinone biosynthesis C-methylase UbiE
VAAPPARYDDVAALYVAGQPDRYDDCKDVVLFELVGPPAGQRILDVACGHGRISRELARRRAAVVGVDISEVLVGMARQAEAAEPLGINYVVSDVAGGDVLAGETFDIAVCNFGLSDIDDLDGALATVTRLLRPGGRFVFAILHPCFPGRGPMVAAAWPPGSGYFCEGWWATEAARSTLRQAVGANHRKLATYLNALVRHGMTIEAVEEPEPPEAWNAATADLDPVPTILAVRCRMSPE